ncbi:hypothetical protein F4804DRAFT_168901 [Jackrogersella minutella]|nr:hypothetical protein F4804DRAFT_168901 [Jackrogersella minutella]
MSTASDQLDLVIPSQTQNWRRRHRQRHSRPPVTPRNRTPEPPESEEYGGRKIIDKKATRSKRYSVSEEDPYTDKKGEPHLSSWEHKEYLPPRAIFEWTKKPSWAKGNTQHTSRVDVNTGPSTQAQEHHNEHRPHFHNPSRKSKSESKSQSVAENRFNEYDSAFREEAADDHSPTKVRSAPSRRRNRDPAFVLDPQASFGIPSGLNNDKSLDLGFQFRREGGTGSIQQSSDRQQGRSFTRSFTNPLTNSFTHNTLTHSTEIPSHQVDHRFSNTWPNLSGSALVTESGSGSVEPNNSQSTISRRHSNFLPQTNSGFDILPQATSQPNSRVSSHPKELPPVDESIYATSVSEDQTSVNRDITVSQESYSQAAQIVVPLSSQQGGLATRSHSNFTVYDGDSIVSDTASRVSQSQQNSQEPSQAFSELDGNTRSASFSKHHRLESQPSSSRIELSRTNMENTDAAAATPLTARERLRQIRERNFASLSKPAATLDTSLAGSEQVENKADTPVVSQAAVQDAQIITEPSRPDISPLTPTPLVSPTFLTQPSKDVPGEPSPQSEIAEALVESHGQLDLGLNETGLVGVGFNATEEQPGTLDPSALTLSIENDMGIIPLISTNDASHPDLQLPESDELITPQDEEDEIPPNYPKSLLPYVPTGPNEHLVTLPFYSNSRPVYNDVLREHEDLIREYNASFLMLPYGKPHPTTVSKLDEMFSRLFDICDLPPFMETVPSMTPAEVTKHVVGTNAKFAFVDELLTCLADVKSDKKILILVRPGKTMDLLGKAVESKGYCYSRSGQEVVGLSTARHTLVVAISSTLETSSSIPDDVDAVIAFDHTYRPELLPSSLRESSPPLLVLTNTCSIQHLNMRVSESLELLERKNVLVLALVKAMRYVEDVGSSQITQLHRAAEVFSDYIQDPDNDDFYWDPQEVPENVFEDLHAASSQAQTSQSDQRLLGADQAPDSRKRSHEADDDDDESSFKRPRVSQPTVVTNISHISDSLKGLLRDDSINDPSNAMLSVSVGKLEALSAKVVSLEAKLQESKQLAGRYRQLNNDSKKEVDGYASTINLMQAKYMEALKDRGIFEDNYYKAKEETRASSATIESSREDNAKLKEKNAELQKQLSAANESLLNSSNPNVAKMAQLDESLKEAKNRIQQLEKRASMAKNDMEYTKNAYQNASQKAGELGAENRELERQIGELSRKANENIVAVNRIHSANESKEMLRMLNEQKSIVRDRDVELGRLKDELKLLRESRRGTRQSSAPRSPRLSAFNNSPRNGGGAAARAAKAGSSSRGTSPAPPPTGVFETGAGGGTPASNNRASHLRETRF